MPNQSPVETPLYGKHIPLKGEYKPPPARSPLQDWHDGISGKVLKVLRAIGDRKNGHVEVRDELKRKETFTYNGQEAHIIKHVLGGVGSGPVNIVPCIESHEYKRLPWWHEAIDAVHQPFEVLPAPVMVVAAEAAVPHAEEIFDPERILIAHARELSALSPVDREHRLQEIRGIIRSEVECFTRDYTVRFSDDFLRMNPVTPDAKGSLTTDNSAYENAKKALIQAAKTLPARYRAIK